MVGPCFLSEPSVQKAIGLYKCGLLHKRDASFSLLFMADVTLFQNGVSRAHHYTVLHADAFKSRTRCVRVLWHLSRHLLSRVKVHSLKGRYCVKCARVAAEGTGPEMLNMDGIFCCSSS